MGGQIDQALCLVAGALALVDNKSERFYEAELHRLKGELLLQQADQKSQDKSLS